MPYDPNKHRRRSIRLPGYDYARPGHYFVTICTHGRATLFGRIDGGAMRVNDAGRMVERWWRELNRKFPTVTTDAFVVMPDHLHGIIVIAAPGDDGIADIDAGGYMNPPLHHDTADSNARINAPNAIPSVGANLHIRPRRTPNESHDADAGGYTDAPRRDDPMDVDGTNAANPNPSLSTIVQWFKIMTTTEYIRHVKQSAWPAFDRRVWQRGYYERIIRDERQLEVTRRYIAENPARSAEGRDDIDTLLARMQAKE